MNQPIDTSSTVQKQLGRLFDDISATLPSRCAHIECKNPRKEIIEMALVPGNEDSAEFGAIFLDGDLYAAFFGRGKLSTTYECPWEFNLRRSDGLEKQLAVIERMCLAVIAGRCEHRLGRLSIRGTINVSEQEVYQVTDLPLFPPRRQRQLIQYAPYYPGAESHSRSFPKLSL